MVTGAEKLLTQGVRQVIITNDTFDGAVLVTENEKLLVDMETDNSGTDSGVTDAMVSGYLVGLSQGKSIADAFKYGAAAMLYASRQLGNQFGTQEDLEPLLAAINLQEFDPALKL